MIIDYQRTVCYCINSQVIGGKTRTTMLFLSGLKPGLLRPHFCFIHMSHIAGRAFGEVRCSLSEEP